MAFRDEAYDAVNQAVVDNPVNLEAAIEQAEAAVRRLPNYKALVEEMVHRAVQDLVYEIRHEYNRKFKNQTGKYRDQQTARQERGGSAEVNRVFLGVYSYFIGGKTVGELTGDELPDLAKGEMERSNGFLLNSRFLAWLIDQNIPANVRVRDKVPEKRAQKKWDSLRKEIMGEAG